MMRLKMVRVWVAGIALLFFAMASEGAAEATKMDVVVYGGTPSGIMAAVESAREGRRVILIQPTKHIGGIDSGGLTKTDIGTLETIGGIPASFFLPLSFSSY